MNNIVFQHKIFTFRNCLWALSKYFTICCLAFNHQSVVWSYSAILCKFLAFDEVPWHSYKKYILYLKEYIHVQLCVIYLLASNCEPWSTFSLSRGLDENLTSYLPLLHLVGMDGCKGI